MSQYPMLRVDSRPGMQVVAGAGLTDGAAVDAWSLGCILAELALKRPLFPCNSSSQLLAQVHALPWCPLFIFQNFQDTACPGACPPVVPSCQPPELPRYWCQYDLRRTFAA